MTTVRMLVGILTLAFWGLFAVADHMWTRVLEQSVRDGHYGELYGPLSFVQPLLFWLTAMGTLVCAVVTIVLSHRSMATSSS